MEQYAGYERGNVHPMGMIRGRNRNLPLILMTRRYLTLTTPIDCWTDKVRMTCTPVSS